MIAKENYELMLQSIAELLVNDFVELMHYKPRVVNPFSVSIQGNGKKRLIANLRHLNKYLKTPHFKIDDLNTTLPSLEEADTCFLLI